MDIFNPNEAYKGIDPVIQVAWRMGLELQIWSEHSLKWIPRPYPYEQPHSHRVFYRIKPTTKTHEQGANNASK